MEMMMMIKIYLAVLIFGVLNTAARTIMLPTTPTGNGTVLLMKSFHIRRSLFLITGSHHNPHDFRDYYSLVHQLPIKIFLLNSQKRRQMRQSNLPPPLHPPKVGGLLSYFDKYKSLYSRNMIEH